MGDRVRAGKPTQFIASRSG